MKRPVLIAACAAFILSLVAGSAYSDVSHKVKAGDNLYTIAKKHHVSVDTIKRLNGLNSIRLKLGQNLIVKKGTDTALKKVTKERPKEIEVSEASGDFIEYSTRKGDTIDRLAAKFNVSRDDILEANELSGKARLAPGRAILIPRATEDQEEGILELTSKPQKDWKSSDERFMLVRVAKSFMGAPYKYGGESVRGLDCSAFVKKIYDIFDVQLPRSAREQFVAGARIEKERISIGDLVFFKTKRYVKYPTHVGIYIGDGNFIHSSSTQCKTGVKVDSLASEFYTRTYVGAVRVKRTPEESSEASTSPSGSHNNT